MIGRFHFFWLAILFCTLFYACSKTEKQKRTTIYSTITDRGGSWYVESYSIFNEEEEIKKNYRALGTITFNTDSTGEYVFLDKKIPFGWALAGEPGQVVASLEFSEEEFLDSPLIFYSNPNFSAPVINKFHVYEIDDESLRFFYNNSANFRFNTLSKVEMILTRK
jgi:hypothetical protein